MIALLILVAAFLAVRGDFHRDRASSFCTQLQRAKREHALLVTELRASIDRRHEAGLNAYNEGLAMGMSVARARQIAAEMNASPEPEFDIYRHRQFECVLGRIPTETQ